MSTIFRIRIDYADFHESYYFNCLPTKEDVLAAIDENTIEMETNFFEQIKLAASIYPWPERMSDQLSEIGHPVYFKETRPGNKPDAYVRIKRCKVRKGARS
jgi:hypothetical protein